MTNSSPGISFIEVLGRATDEYIRRLLGQPLYELLNLIDGGAASPLQLRQVASRAIDIDEFVSDDLLRAEFLDLLPDIKQTELLRRLAIVNGATAVKDLDAIQWGPEARRELLEFLGFTVDTQGPTANASLASAPSIYPLFPHQRVAVAKVQPLLADGPRRTMLHLPTGVGKTRTAMNIICDHLRRTEPTVVVWLAHGKELLEQAAAEFSTSWSSLGNRELAIARVWGTSDMSAADIPDGLVVLGLEKAASALRTTDRLRKLPTQCSLVVFDEAHQAIAPTYRAVTDSLTIRPNCGLLGLTATPGRTWADTDKDQELSDYFSGQKVMLEIDGYTNPVTALIEQGYLSRPIFRTVNSTAGFTMSNAERTALLESFEIPSDLVENIAFDSQWNLKIIGTILDLVERHVRILVFAASVAHCRIISAVLLSVGIDAQYVTGASSPRERDTAIHRFKSKSPRPMVLCNYGVLTTGFDAPAASAAVIARPTKSLVLYSQMVGRVIRGPKAGGTPTCEIVTVVDTELTGFGDVAEAFQNWEDVWENA